MTWLVAMISSTAGFLFGYDEGIIAGSIDLVKAHFALSPLGVALTAAALPCGALLSAMAIGALLISHHAKKIGRRTLLAHAGFLFLLGALGAALANTVSILIISRFVLGFAIGIASVVTPLYLAETAPIDIRGAIVAVYQLAITLGIVSAYGINYVFLQQGDWRTMLASSMLPALLLCCAMFFLPESPRWLLSIGQKNAAKKALQKLRKGLEIDDEFEHIISTIAHEPEYSHWRQLFQKNLLPVLSLGVILFCLQQLSGINVVICFAPDIFKSLGFNDSLGQILATIGIGLANMLVTLIALYYVDKVGRRQLLMLGFAGACLSLFALSVFSSLHLPGLAFISVACLTIYIFSFALSIGPIPHIMMSEIFPLHVRGLGMGLSSTSNWLFNTLIIFFFPLMQAQMKIDTIFALFALVCGGGFLFSYYCLPETKHMSLEDIEDHLMSGRSLRTLGGTDQSVTPSLISDST